MGKVTFIIVNIKYNEVIFMNHIKTKLQVLCALFAALCAVCAQVVIPVQPVPITLGTFAVLLAGGFLGARYGLISLCIYILLGIVGVPVFSMMKGGLAVLGGPTGGFIIGYLPMVFLTGFIVEKMGATFKNALIATLCGTLACYIFGIGWFIVLTGKAIGAAFMLCMYPFIPGDFAKIIISSLIISRYKKRLLAENR